MAEGMKGYGPTIDMMEEDEHGVQPDTDRSRRSRRRVQTRPPQGEVGDEGLPAGSGNKRGGFDESQQGAGISKPEASIGTPSSGGSSVACPTAQGNQSPKLPTHNPAKAGHNVYHISNVARLPRLPGKKASIPARASLRRPAGTHPLPNDVSGRRSTTRSRTTLEDDFEMNRHPRTFVTDRTRKWDTTVTGLLDERNLILPSNQHDYDLSLDTMIAIHSSEVYVRAAESCQASTRLISRADHDAAINTLRGELETEVEYWRSKWREFEGQPMNGTGAESQHSQHGVDDHEDESSRESAPSCEACEGSDPGPDMMMTITKAEHDEIVDKLKHEMGADVEYWKAKAEEMKNWISNRATEMSTFVSGDAHDGQPVSCPEPNQLVERTLMSHLDTDMNPLNPVLDDMDKEDDDEDHPNDHQSAAPSSSTSNASPEQEDARLTSIPLELPAYEENQNGSDPTISSPLINVDDNKSVDPSVSLFADTFRFLVPKRAKEKKKEIRKLVQCGFCGKGVNSRYIKRHRLIHEVRTWKCDECGKMFVTKSNLKQHRSTHATSSAFPCALCGKAYKHGSALSYHRKHDHRPSHSEA